jgi:hypothetical protein
MMPSRVFVALTLVTFLLAPAGLVTLVVLRRWRGEPLAPLLLAMLLGGTAIYTFVTAMLGDGMNEAARHYLPGSLATYAALLMTIAGVAMLLMRWKETPKESFHEGLTGAVVIALAGFGVMTAMHWIYSQPAGDGVLDAPAGRTVPANGFALRGWALEPSGVAAVTARVGTIEKSARIGEPSPTAGLLRVESIHSGYPDAKTAGFALDLTAEDLAKAGAPNPLTMRILVHGKNGAITEIDRRNLEFSADPTSPPK